MNELLNQFEEYVNEMERALVGMDAARVSALSMQQETCLAQIQSRLVNHPDERAEVQRRMVQLQPVFDRNQLLLANAMEVTDNYIRRHVAFDERA